MSDEFENVEWSFLFAVSFVKVCRILERQGRVSGTLAHQLLRAGTSIGADIVGTQAGHPGLHHKNLTTAKNSSLSTHHSARNAFLFHGLFSCWCFPDLCLV